MNQITSGPNPTPDFGYAFDYAVWTAGTRVDLVNVPWNNDYRDVVKFNSRSALDTYIDDLSPAGISVSKMTYVKPNTPIRVNVPFNRAARYNYLRASNPIQPVQNNDVQKNFYYFIIDIRYVAPNTTELVLQLDVWQTFVYDVTFGNCYIERGHIGIANTNAFNNYGRDYLTVPEGLDVGSDYLVQLKSNNQLMNASTGDYSILLMSSIDLGANPGTSDNPVITTAIPGTLQGLPTGFQVLIWESFADFGAFITEFKDFPWALQGVITVAVIPSIHRYNNNPISTTDPKLHGAYTGSMYTAKTLNHDLMNNWRDLITATLPVRYRSLKKFLTSPYCMVELTPFSGAPTVLRPENWNNDNATVMERTNVVYPNQRTIYSPRNYNAAVKIINPTGDDGGEYLDTIVGITNFPTLPITVDGASLYLANNAYQFAYQRQSADWSQQRALGAVQASYDVQTGAIRNYNTQAGIGITADMMNTAIQNQNMQNQAFINTVGGTLQGAVGAGIFGGKAAMAGAGASGVQGLSGQIGAAVQAGANNQSLGVRNNAARQSASSETSQMSLARDTNTSLERWAARGDYANTIAGINAKIQQADVIPPSVNGQAGGETMNLAYGEMGIFARFKMIDLANIRRIGEYWLRYGYSINTFIKPPQSLMVMSKFTYWKMTETYISASTVPEGFKQAIRGIMEKGFTNWANPNDIGNIDIADNIPLGGISY